MIVTCSQSSHIVCFWEETTFVQELNNLVLFGFSELRKVIFLKISILILRKQYSALLVSKTSSAVTTPTYTNISVNINNGQHIFFHIFILFIISIKKPTSYQLSIQSASNTFLHVFQNRILNDWTKILYSYLRYIPYS